ncbi:MAG: carbonate dehydratase [bacterium]|nr:carbonate dehydratase [bacterium]
MKYLPQLFANNREWAKRMTAQDPEFFRRLAAIQSPEYLWIGCSDSRVPANQITGLNPGEVFVHRNIANIVVADDTNCLAVIQFAVDVLKVKHIIVCGHYGCGGVKSALLGESHGIVDDWLVHIRDIQVKHTATLSQYPSTEKRWNRLCELNVIEQVVNICQTSIARDAWSRGQQLDIHGWIYDLQDGLLRDLEVSLDDPNRMKQVYSEAIDKIRHSA